MQETRKELMGIIGAIVKRGWAPATAGNFSIKIGSVPLRLLISPSGTDKTLLTEKDLLEVSDRGEVLAGKGMSSAEMPLHVAVYQERKTEGNQANCVLHVHTIWNTLISERFKKHGEIQISGYEMLKALTGVTTHEHTELIPIFENSQDMAALSQKVHEELESDQTVKAFLLAGHGVYTWGATPLIAYRHLEALEFLFEVLVRTEHINPKEVLSYGTPAHTRVK